MLTVTPRVTYIWVLACNFDTKLFIWIQSWVCRCSCGEKFCICLWGQETKLLKLLKRTCFCGFHLKIENFFCKSKFDRNNVYMYSNFEMGKKRREELETVIFMGVMEHGEMWFYGCYGAWWNVILWVLWSMVKCVNCSTIVRYKTYECWALLKAVKLMQ